MNGDVVGENRLSVADDRVKRRIDSTALKYLMDRVPLPNRVRYLTRADEMD